MLEAKTMSKLTATIVTALALPLLLPAVVFAHVIVTPDQVGIGQSILFDVSVPNERQTEVTSVKLLIPGNVSEVMPTVSAGWSISMANKNDVVTAITWTGKIPVGQRADFTFKARAPGETAELDWKAYQTYADGSVIGWDQRPSQNSTVANPYSVTKVVDDLDSPDKAAPDNDSRLALAFGIAALALSAGGLFIRGHDQGRGKSRGGNGDT